MVSFDTNLAVYATNSDMAQHSAALEFVASLAGREDVIVCELMLVELYLKLRNRAIFPHPLSAAAAVERCQQFRENVRWRLVESAPIMEQVWKEASARDFAFRRIIDVRLALTLRHHGVTEFATSNEKDFAGFGFARVWNPLRS